MSKTPPDRPAKSSKAAPSNHVICQNRRARHDFAIEEKLEAGLVLVGTEVKACRAGKVHLNDAYVHIERDEAYLLGGNIAEYSHGNQQNHLPVRRRKLLLHRREVDRLSIKLHERGYSAVPLSMYFKAGRVKVEIGVGRGKTHVDRRDDIRDREVKRELQRTLRRAHR